MQRHSPMSPSLMTTSMCSTPARIKSLRPSRSTNSPVVGGPVRPAARAHVPWRNQVGWLKPLQVRDGKHPRAELVGAHAPARRGHREGKGRSPNRCSKASLLEDLIPKSVPVEQAAMVIGGGVGGMQLRSTCECRDQDLPHREKPSIGGRMSQLDKTFPTLTVRSVS